MGNGGSAASPLVDICQVCQGKYPHQCHWRSCPPHRAGALRLRYSATCGSQEKFGFGTEANNELLLVCPCRSVAEQPWHTRGVEAWFRAPLGQSADPGGRVVSRSC